MGRLDLIGKARAWGAISEKDFEIGMLKGRLAQAEADRDSYKEQMVRAQIEIHALKTGNSDGF